MAGFSIHSYITKENCKLNLVALKKNVFSLVSPHVYYKNLVNLFLMRINVCKYRKKMVELLCPGHFPVRMTPFLERNVSLVPWLLG